MGTPMAHVCKSMLGRQPVSHLRSSPSFGFGTEERMKVSGKSGGLSSSPGPVYYPLTKTYNNYPKSPSHSFGAGHRYTKVSSADSSHRLTLTRTLTLTPTLTLTLTPNLTLTRSARQTLRTARRARAEETRHRGRFTGKRPGCLPRL